MYVHEFGFSTRSLFCVTTVGTVQCKIYICIRTPHKCLPWPPQGKAVSTLFGCGWNWLKPSENNDLEKEDRGASHYISLSGWGGGGRGRIPMTAKSMAFFLILVPWCKDRTSSRCTTYAVKKNIIKGTVSRDFLLLVFFMNQFPPSPRVFHLDRFEFFRKFAEIFAS